MPALSKSQQRLFGMVAAYKKGQLPNASPEIRGIADTMSLEEIEHFARTKHGRLPEKKAFAPDLKPEDLAEAKAQLYEGKGPRLASLPTWPKEWLHKEDPGGWIEWYEKYSKGRRMEDDDRQIARWKSFKARHGSAFAKNPTPRRGYALRNWAIDPLKLIDESKRTEVAQAMKAYREKLEKKAAAVPLTTFSRLGQISKIPLAKRQALAARLTKQIAPATQQMRRQFENQTTGPAVTHLRSNFLTPDFIDAVKQKIRIVNINGKPHVLTYRGVRGTNRQMLTRPQSRNMTSGNWIFNPAMPGHGDYRALMQAGPDSPIHTAAKSQLYGIKTKPLQRLMDMHVTTHSEESKLALPTTYSKRVATGFTGKYAPLGQNSLNQRRFTTPQKQRTRSLVGTYATPYDKFVQRIRDGHVLNTGHVANELEIVQPNGGNLVRIKKAAVLEDLKRAKEFSDRGDYKRKTLLLQRMMQDKPSDWKIDSEYKNTWGITHKPTKFQFHLPKYKVTAQIDRPTP